MSQIEDVLRRAMAAAAHTVTSADIASAVRELEEVRPARPQRLVLPALATVAVVLIAIVITIVPGLLSRGPRPAASPRREPLIQQPQPGFFAALPASGGAIQIRSAFTGRLIAVVAPPAPGEFFSGVAATGVDSQTLLVAVERKTGSPCKTWLFQLRLSVTGQPGALRPAEVPYLDGILPNRAFTATQDGSAIAFADYCQGSRNVEIDRLHTGVSINWFTAAGDQVDDISLSSDGATLGLSGYEYAGSGPGAKPGTSSVRLRPATAVLHASSANTPIDGQGIVVGRLGAAALSPDGKTLYLCIRQGRLDVLSSYDVAAKALRRKVASWAAGGCSFALDPAGHYALVAAAGGRLARLDMATGTLTTLPVSGVPSSAVLAW
ncbi:MAG TPA: hypothetical protein VMA72_01225 [Streptosporangiaceae bacterium]|nr:hypothetical protein [Streptosporangiaceae bacterium]